MVFANQIGWEFSFGTAIALVKIKIVWLTWLSLAIVASETVQVTAYS